MPTVGVMPVEQLFFFLHFQFLSMSSIAFRDIIVNKKKKSLKAESTPRCRYI